jgi:hypothetical protein
MKENKSFLLGIVTVVVAIPVLEALVDLVLTWVEALKIKPTTIVLKGNKDLQELQTTLEKVDDGVAIGFQYTGDEELDYEDDDLEDKKSNHKIGFVK